VETDDTSPFMALALAQADLARGRTAPRPPVGAVVVLDDQIIGVGYTQPPGGPHAEVVALAQAGARARGADLYVTLEPCCHDGTTPPCTHAILAAGIARVWVAIRDPNPHVNGGGIARLRAAGVEVFSGNGAAQARRQLAPFFKHILTGQPYCIAKWAMTLDGRVATRSGDSQWISGPQARAWVHDLRDTVDAIVIGAGTARQDDPALTVRLPEAHPALARPPRAHPPLRVVIAGRKSLPNMLRLFSPALASGTLVVLGEGSDAPWAEALLAQGAEVARVAVGVDGQPDLAAVSALLGQRGIMAALLEGGPTLMAAAFAQGMIDEAAVFVAPRLLGGSDGPAPLVGPGAARMANALDLYDCQIDRIGGDALINGRIPRPWWELSPVVESAR
jgi:diaminohydroxyphosphoribosylaminopyrimidine deaminase/5-amino-6-(5-phosphoribosylamino)uracil reductase